MHTPAWTLWVLLLLGLGGCILCSAGGESWTPKCSRRWQMRCGIFAEVVVCQGGFAELLPCLLLLAGTWLETYCAQGAQDLS